jgi:hypothetical protein
MSVRINLNKALEHVSDCCSVGTKLPPPDNNRLAVTFDPLAG